MTKNLTRREVGIVAAVLWGFILCAAAPSWAAQVFTGAQGSGGEINVTADKLSAGNGGNQIEATGNVQIQRQEMILKADEVRVNQVTKDV